jgi:hypothetical protein
VFSGVFACGDGHLKDESWTDEAHTETLCALAVWRAEIDESGQDPREELAFQTQLADYSHTLRQEGGGVAKAWKPGAPPDNWAGGQLTFALLTAPTG